MSRLADDIRALFRGRGEHAAGPHPLLPGVDISVFQGTPADWRVQAGAIKWAAVKLTELGTDGSRYVNPDAAADWEWLKAHGKGRVGYLFGHPATSSGSTAAFFTAEIRALGLGDGDAVALDLEVTDGRGAAEVAAWAGDVMGLLERALDRTPVLYTFLSFADSGNCAGLGRYPLWIADPSSPPGHPRVPAPWQAWALHQHSITGSIDRDVAPHATLAQMQAALGKKAPVQHAGHVTTGRESWVEIAADHKVGAAYLLRLNGGPGEPFPEGMRAYINAGNLRAPMPAGITVRVPPA